MLNLAGVRPQYFYFLKKNIFIYIQKRKNEEGGLGQYFLFFENKKKVQEIENQKMEIVKNQFIEDK